MNRVLFVAILALSLSVGLLAGAQPAESPAPPAAPVPPPENNERLRENMKRWESMTPEQRERTRELFKRWQSVTEEERQKVRANFDRFRRMKEDKRKAILHAHEMMQHMQPKVREDLRRRMGEWQNMPPERRRGMMQKLEAVQGLLHDDYETLRALPPESPEARRLAMDLRVKATALRSLKPEEMERLKGLAPEERAKEVQRIVEERRLKFVPGPEGGRHRPPVGPGGPEGREHRDGPRRPPIPRPPVGRDNSTT